MESPLKPDSSDVETIDLLKDLRANLLDTITLEEIEGTIFMMAEKGLDKALSTIRILYQAANEEQKNAIAVGVCDSMLGYYLGMRTVFAGKEPLSIEAMKRIITFVDEEIRNGQTSVLQQDSPASSDADEKGGERKDQEDIHW